MNVKQLIEKYKRLEGVWDAPGAETARQIFLQDLEQLDEPQKVKVSEEEAGFLETFDFDRDSDITKALYYASRAGWGHHITDNNNVEMKDLTEKVVIFVKNRKRLIKAILFGYTVEKEPKYTVRVKATLGQYLGRYYLNNEELTPQFTRTQFTVKEKLPTFTRKELEDANFGWVFYCDGVEVQEVE